MTTLKAFLITLLLAIYGCKPTPSKQSIGSKAVEHEDSIATNDIYDFMKVVIADQKLRKSNGLSIEPRPDCDESISDKEFLTTLLIDTANTKTTTDTAYLKDGSMIEIERFGQLDKCLDSADISFMLKQKVALSNFRWDNSRLGFNINNDENWYAFSVPLFSKDKTKAVMMIKDLCRGLCGGGWTVLFKKEHNQWTSQTGSQWLH